MNESALHVLRAAPPALVPARLERLAQGLALSEFERALVALCFAVETDAAAGQAVAALCGEQAGSGVPIAVAHAVLGTADWAATSPGGALRRWRVLEASPGLPRVQQRLRLAEAVTDALLGLNAPDARLTDLLVALPAQGACAPALRDEVAQVLGGEHAGVLSPLVVLAPGDGLDVAADLAMALGLAARRLDAARLGGTRMPVDELQRTLERDSLFAPCVVVLQVPADPAAGEAAARFVDTLAAHVLVVGDPPAGTRRAVHRCALAGRCDASTTQRWRQALGDAAATRLNGSVERVASQFRLSPQRIADAAARVRPAIEAAGDEAAAAALLWRAGRNAAWPEPGPLASVHEPVATLDDLVVPPPVRAELEALVRHVRHGATVYDRWGFAAGLRGRGLTALFAGPSGTGKTLAAEAIAHALALPLVVADFSQLQSKWVGETAKLAAHLFDELDRGGAVLLLDEADGLLGRRGAVVEAHDRHANADVAFFLQRLETFRGLAILTSNMKSAIDEAFLRRYRFVIDFPCPGPDERLRLWERAFPPAAPREGLDLQSLARLPVTGGTIRNVALHAAFAAAEAGRPIAPAHLLEALRSEYRKLERPVSELATGFDA